MFNILGSSIRVFNLVEMRLVFFPSNLLFELKSGSDRIDRVHIIRNILLSFSELRPFGIFVNILIIFKADTQHIDNLAGVN